jgi:enterochelin esterase family protein
VHLSVAFLVAVSGVAQPIPALRSPEILPDKRVTFRLDAPKAGEVKVTGEFLKQPVSLQKNEKGVWTATVGPVKPDIYSYTFSVDGMRMVDPLNPDVRVSARPNAHSSVLEVPGDGPMPYDLRAVSHGTVQVRWYPSKTLDRVRRVHIYTPPNYDRVSTRYPVLYLIHGAGSDDTAWTAQGRAHLILDNLIADGKLKPLVVVMPDAYAYPIMSAEANAPDAQPRQVAMFTKDLIEDLIPFVGANYRVNNDREHRAIAGLSLGGGRALTIGLAHVEVFSRVAGFSAALVAGVSKDSFPEVVANPKKLNDGLKLLWVGCGTEDTLFNANKGLYEFLGKNGVKATFHPSDGAHTWQVWRRYLVEVAPMLFPQS